MRRWSQSCLSAVPRIRDSAIFPRWDVFRALQLYHETEEVFDIIVYVWAIFQCQCCQWVLLTLDVVFISMTSNMPLARDNDQSKQWSECQETLPSPLLLPHEHRHSHTQARILPIVIRPKLVPSLCGFTAVFKYDWLRLAADERRRCDRAAADLTSRASHRPSPSNQEQQIIALQAAATIHLPSFPFCSCSLVFIPIPMFIHSRANPN